MPRLVLLLILFSSATAAASSRSAHLLPRDEPLRLRLIQSAPGAEGAPIDPLPELGKDPFARRVSGREVAVGAAMVLGADLVSAFTGGGVGLVAWLAGTDPLVAVVAGFLTFLGVDLVLAPAAAALGAYSVAPQGGNNGLLGAVLGAGMAQLAYTAIFVGATAGFGVLFRVLRPENLAAQGGALLVSLILLVVHAAVLPAGASLGIHWAPPEPQTKPLAPATTPHETFSQALLRPAPLFAIRF